MKQGARLKPVSENDAGKVKEQMNKKTGKIEK